MSGAAAPAFRPLPLPLLPQDDTLTSVIPRSLAALVTTTLPLLTSAQWLDYAAIQGSANNASVVLVKAMPAGQPTQVPALISATAARWEDGETVAIGFTPRWALVDGEHQWLVGAGVGANYYSSRGGTTREDESAVSARAQTEFIGPAPGGWYYVLLQGSTFRGGAFATAQYALQDTPWAFETTYYRETSYHAYGLGLRVALPAEHWFVRFGASHDDRTRAYFGLVYNGF